MCLHSLQNGVYYMWGRGVFPGKEVPMAFDVGRASASALRRRVVVLSSFLEDGLPVLRMSPEEKARVREIKLAELAAVKRRLSELDSDSH